ncbi:hypothetical protein Y59_22810 [Enterobacter hormaechei]|nr:hypothetical protein Y59_22810 [Enterobacter hormaechei]
MVNAPGSQRVKSRDLLRARFTNDKRSGCAERLVFQTSLF